MNNPAVSFVVGYVVGLAFATAIFGLVTFIDRSLGRNEHGPKRNKDR